MLILRINHITFFCIFLSITGNTQTNIDDFQPKTYILRDILFEGTDTYDHNSLLQITELRKGQTIQIPGDALSIAIRKLWDQNLFDDIKIYADPIKKNEINLIIKVKSRSRIVGFRFKGDLSKSETEEFREEMGLFNGEIITKNRINNATNKIRDSYRNERYLRAQVNVKDSIVSNGVFLVITVKKGDKYKINQINFHGQEHLSNKQLRRIMKDTKSKTWYNFLSPSKFKNSNYEIDKQNIITYYNNIGYRDAKIVRDTIYDFNKKSINIDIQIHEGNKYYLRNIRWIGNEKYASGFLDTILGLSKGDVYNKALFEQQLRMSPSRIDVSSLYLDSGYVFFNINSTEKLVENDSIDIEIQINEGVKAKYKDIIIRGNNLTNEHVLRRYIRTKPGEYFNRNDIIRTQRELSQLPYVNLEAFNVTPIPNPEDGTVNIEYTIEDISSDKIELQGGWGNGGIIGTVGLSFYNFSAKKILSPVDWDPIPTGDGQTLTLRASATGPLYHSYNFSFTEPWLGKKKPKALSISAYKSFITQNNAAIGSSDPGKLKSAGASIGWSFQHKWPDDYYSSRISANIEQYKLNNFSGPFEFSDGTFNNLNLQYNLSRNSIDEWLYPRKGSQINFTSKLTPLALFKSHSNFVEYYKFKLSIEHYTPIGSDKKRKLVLKTRAGFGLLGKMNNNLELSPFERFYLGGTDFSWGQQFSGSEYIYLRGYPAAPYPSVSSTTGSAVISKYQLELRYLLFSRSSTTAYLLGFTEAGNTWNSLKSFTPFNVKRSAGVGIRLYLPMLGQLGVDFGWGFDSLDQGAAGNLTAPVFAPSNKPLIHFTFGRNIEEL